MSVPFGQKEMHSLVNAVSDLQNKLYGLCGDYPPISWDMDRVPDSTWYTLAGIASAVEAVDEQVDKARAEYRRKCLKWLLAESEWEQRPKWEYCGRGPCCMPAGHEGRCSL